MSEMHEIILESTTQIFKDHCTKELIDTLENGEWASTMWDILVQSGITLVGVSESAGGSGGDYKDAVHIMQLAGKYAVPLPLSETILVNWLIASYGGEVSGHSPYTYSLNFENELEIKEANDGFLINGVIKNISWARNAEKLLVITNISGKDVIVLLPLELSVINLNQNLAGEPLDSVNFESVYLEDLWFQVVSKKEIMERISNLTSLSKAAMMSGAMERILELSIQYTSEREQFGRPLHRFQAIQQHLAILAGETVATLTIVNETIALFNRNKYGVGYEIAIAKMRANEATEVITDLSHQIHGAIGTTHEHSLHQLTRRLWSWREEGGNEKYCANKMTKRIMESEESLWSIITDTNLD